MMYPFKILNKKKYALCFLNAIIENICIYIIPVILAIFLTQPFTLKKFALLIVFVLIAQLLSSLFNSLWFIKVEPFLENSKKDLQIAYFKRIYKMDTARLNSIHSGYLKKQVDTVCEQTRFLLDEIMMDVNGFCIAITIFLVGVFTQNKVLFFLCLLFIVGIVLYNIYLTKRNVKISEKYYKTNAKYNATFIDFLQNIKIVKNFEAKDYAVNTIEDKFSSVKNPYKRTNIFDALRTEGINCFIYLMYAFILVSLFFQMKHGKDVFSYIVFYTSMLTGLSVELSSISNLFISINKFKSANNQVEKMIGEIEKQSKIKTFDNITLQNIHFSYNDEKQNIITIPYFSIDKNDKISIIGESGQGKSTFLSLFCRFYKVEDTSYLVDHCPSSKIPAVAYISQETELFDLSIKENLCLGKRISEEKLRVYLEDAGLLHWIDSLENGMDTLVGEKGVKLSAGQKQRLNIIRGILLDKEIYILDEPTSNLDSLSEHKIYDMINKYLKNKTCIIVTHRPKLTEMCNKHFYFENKTMLEKK